MNPIQLKRFFVYKMFTCLTKLKIPTEINKKAFEMIHTKYVIYSQNLPFLEFDNVVVPTMIIMSNSGI